jgi:hypothetical protein
LYEKTTDTVFSRLAPIEWMSRLDQTVIVLRRAEAIQLFAHSSSGVGMGFARREWDDCRLYQILEIGKHHPHPVFNTSLR